ncbi:MAG TPA: flagellar assembly protein T N-terminal domain-containing protein [Syntrophales bacterium]|nr:flagellar assembly protein T N-terminal domain-containing protein [Syntrophales bacterium]
MRKTLVIVYALVMFLTLPLFPSYAQDKVKAMGMATIYDNAVDIARDKAIENAQRNAVEEKAGVMITSVTEVENFQVKMDQLLSDSKGFINSYGIISEGRVGNNYKVTIEADIGTGRLKDRMAAVDLIMTRKSRPRLIVIMSEKAQKDAIAEAAIAKYFMSNGFKVVDSDSVKKGKVRDLEGDRKEVAKIAQMYGAEIAILCKVEVVSKAYKMSDVKMGDIEVTSNDVTVSGKVINGDTGEVIATDSKMRKGELTTAVDDAAKELARGMKEELLERWSSEVTNVATVKVEVSGLHAYRDLLRFKELLAAKVKGFRQLYQRSYAGGELEVDIELKGNTQSLADDMAAIAIGSRKIKILKITQNKVEAKFAP